MRRVFFILLLLTGCDGEVERQNETRAVRLQAWQACIDRGGAPIENSWLGAPAMERCEFPSTPAASGEE